MVPKRQRLLQCFKRFFFAEVAQKAHDQRGADAQISLRFDAGAVQAADDGLHADAPGRMRLRVEKQLGVDHIVLGCSQEVSTRHVVKILFCEQHAGARVIDIEKALQIGECVSAAQIVHAGIGKRYPIALRQRKNQFRLQ